MKNQASPSFKAKRARSLSKAVAEQLEDRRMLSVAVLVGHSDRVGPFATPDAQPATTGPTVVTAASATPSPVTGTTTNLTVLGDDDAGESDLTYSWATVGAPPAAVSFSVNNSNDAKNTVASFTAPGTYNFQVTLTDSDGQTAISTVSVVVAQTATTVVVTPAAAVVAASASTQLTAIELDQFGAAMGSQPTFSWSITAGTGSVNSSGLYTAAATAGPVTVSAADGTGPSGSTSLTVAAPLVWYQADASSGTTLVDSSGNNQTAALTAGSTYFNTGYSGNAVNFDGGYATLPTGILSSVNDFTISAWVNIPILTPGAPIFDFGTGTGSYMYLTADSSGTGGLTFGITNSGQSAEQQVNGPTLTAGAWEHLAVTLAGSQATLYVNGVAVVSGTITLTPASLGSTTQNYLAKSQFATDPALYGAIDDFRIYSAALSAPQIQQVATLSMPAGWSDTDIGSPPVPGSAGYDSANGVWTLNSSGANVYGTDDQLNFASTALSGDLVLTAEVTSVGNSSLFAQAGLMVRSSMATNSTEVSIVATPGNGVEFLSRSATGGTTAYDSWTTGIAAPVWLQLDRYGSFVSGYLSNDDVHWYQVGYNAYLPAANPVLAGLASTSHGSADSESTFAHVSVAPNAAPTIVSPASASLSTLVGNSTTLSVLAADDAGQQFLTYSWATDNTAPAPVSFSQNGTVNAQITQATFTASGTYNLIATITDADGAAVQSSVAVTVSIPPAAPAGITALWSGTTAVRLNWQSVTGAASYNVYRSTTIGGEGSTPLATGVTGSSFTDSSVTVGLQYYYQITAVSSGALESPRSFEVAAMTTAYSTPIISEFVASNSTELADAAGQYPDWLELYNPTASTVTLTGDYLTSTAGTLAQWKIPSATLTPGAFLVIFADSENDTDSTGVFHTNFNIGASGGYLALVASNGTTVLSAYTYPIQVSDVAYGIGMSQTGSVTSYGGVGFLTPTPGTLNGPVVATGTTAEPTFNYPSGFYSTSIQLQISSTTAGATIYYTLDGTAPSATNGTLYTGPLTISGQTDIRAMAIAPENFPSMASAATYIYLSQVLTQSANGQAPAGWPVDWGFSLVHYGMDPSVVNNPAYSSQIAQDLLDLPSVSLSMNLQDLFDPATGIYSESQLSQGVDKPGSIELINPGGAAGFQADVGVSLKGDSSTLSPNVKHGFDIQFSSAYGISELDYPVFGASAAQSFKEIQLRTDQDNSWSFSSPQTFIGIRDEFTSALLAATGQAAEHFKICFLYINGMFWGLYDIIEKPDDDFAASYFGETASSYDVLKAENISNDLTGNIGAEPIDGTGAAWDQLYTDLSTLDLSTSANFEMIQGKNADGSTNPAYPDLIDVNNLINYMLVMYYTGNLDAPYSILANCDNNFYAIRPTDGSFGFRFIATDSEYTILDPSQDVLGDAPAATTPFAANPAYFFEQLYLQNAQFVKEVGDAVQKDFFNGGPMSTAAATAMFNGLVAQVQGPVVGESARWGDALRPGEAYTYNNDWEPLIQSMLSSYFPTRTQTVLGQLEAFGLYAVTPPPPTFSQYGGTVASGFALTMSLNGTAGAIYYTINGSDPQNADGSLSSTAILYTGAVSLYTSTEVKARNLARGSWSALIDESFVVNAVSPIRITELNYDPGKPPTGSSYNNDDFEFVELENFSGHYANLAGIAFTDGIKYTFGNVTLGPWQLGVLVHNTAAFVSRYGSTFNIIGDYLSTGESFSNSGEDVELVDAQGNVLDHFDYTPTIAAYPTAHGKGAALIASNPDGAVNLSLAANWSASTLTNGTVPLLLGTSPEYLMLNSSGQSLEIWNAATNTGTPALTLPLAELTSMTFAVAAAADTLTIDFTNGNPFAAAPLYVNGNVLGNLKIVGTSGADTLTINASTLTFAGSFGSTTMYYDNVANVSFNGNGGADTLTQAAQPVSETSFTFASTSSDTVNVNTGTLYLTASAAGDTPVTIGTISVASGATFGLLSSTVAGNQNELVVNNLSLAGSAGAWTGKLDLCNNNLILKNGNLATVIDQLTTGFNTGGGYFNGVGGIVSSAAENTGDTTLAYENGGTTIDGVATTASDVIVKYTYFGDANLDGVVDGSDYSRIDYGFLSHLTGWMNGDFNYDGVINGSDYTLIDNAFNSQQASLAAEIAEPAESRKTVSNTAIFQSQSQISFDASTADSIENLMQAKDVLDLLSAAR